MRSLLLGALTGNQAIAAPVQALVVRIENIYESGDEYFAVDVDADWCEISFELTVRGESRS